MPFIAYSLIALTVAAARPNADSSRGLAPDEQIVFTTTDSALTGPPSAGAGYVRFALRNTSRQLMAHELVRVRDGVSPADGVRALRVYWKLEPGDQADAVKKLDRFYGGAVFVPPGQTKAVGMTLPPGNYVVYADVIPDHGPPIVRDGYVRAFRVTAPTGPVATPAKPDVTVRMVDHAFAMPRTVKAGRARWRVENGGKELHLAFLSRLRPGKTMKDAQAWLKDERGPSPFENIATMSGVHALSAGVSNDVELDLAPGEYVLVCFIAGHHLRGMAQPLTVTQ